MKETKFDLLSAIVAFVAGGVIAFVVCNVLLPAVKDETFKTIENSFSGEVGVPSEEIFNANAINPTVEVCVGCTSDDNAAVESEDVKEAE